MMYRKLHAPISPDQSATIPYRIREGEIEVLLITTRKQGKWIIPKGWIESHLSAHMSAAREAHEEAGVRGRVSPVSLGCYRHGSSDDDPIVEVFLMRVEREEPSWPEQEERERRWVSLDEAYLHVEDDGLRSVLDDAAAVMRLGLDADDASDNDATHPAIPDSTSGRSS
jgi:8-oxo-dGTP pyrophosphatase MutT (NUDIX family)